MALELLERAEVAEPVHQSHWGTGHEAVGLDLAAVAQRVETAWMFEPDHENRPAAIARGAQHEAADALEGPAQEDT